MPQHSFESTELMPAAWLAAMTSVSSQTQSEGLEDTGLQVRVPACTTYCITLLLSCA